MVDQAAIIGFAVPAIAGCMAAIFLSFWHYNRQDVAAANLAVAFLFCALGFTLNHFVLAKDTLANALIHNGCYAAGLVLLVRGMCLGFARKAPVLLLSIIGAASVAAAGIIQFTDGGLATRIVTLNWIHGCMLILGAVWLRGIWHKGWTGTAVFASTLLCILNFMVIAPLTLHDGLGSLEGFFASAYWWTMNLITMLSVLAMGGSLVSVCVLKRLHALRDDADRDFLTSLRTRRAFERMASEYCRERSGEIAASLILIDLDHFKAINDTYGHAAGDSVIRAFGQFLSRQTRRSDICGRVGGEEFCLLLPGTDLWGAGRLAERLKSTLAQLEIPDLTAGETLTASFGIAEFGAETPFEDVYAAADAALYVAKEQGRDRIVSAEPPEVPGRPIRREKLTPEPPGEPGQLAV